MAMHVNFEMIKKKANCQNSPLPNYIEYKTRYVMHTEIQEYKLMIIRITIMNYKTSIYTKYGGARS